MKISGYKFGHPVFGIDDYYDFRPEISIEQKIEDLNSAGLSYKETESPVKIIATRLFHFNNFHLIW